MNGSNGDYERKADYQPEPDPALAAEVKLVRAKARAALGISEPGNVNYWWVGAIALVVLVFFVAAVLWYAGWRP